MTFVHQFLEELDSTNNVLWELSEKVQLTEFHTVSTDYQWNGRGQDRNIWFSSKAQNILLSALVFPNFLKASDAFQISRWVSLSILDFLKDHKIKDAKIKWPNDIYVRNKKIAGILIQNAISGNHLSKSLVGIGLNINEKDFPKELPNPVSLFQLVQRELLVLEESDHLIRILQKNYQLIKKSPQKIIKLYHQKLYQLGEWAKYQIKNEIQEAKILGVDEFGRLEIENRRGVVSQFDLKEIKFVL